jgi:DNA-binding transcriptional regulator YdaS (Cro superfamily)
MKSMLKAFYTKPLTIYLAVALLAISTFAGPAEAMFVPAAPHQNMTGATAVSAGRAADMAKIQTAFESKILQQKLMDYGLSPEETLARVNKLSDEQIHQLATHTDSLQAGGDPVGFLVGLVVLALLVVLLIYLIQGRVEIK